MVIDMTINEEWWEEPEDTEENDDYTPASGIKYYRGHYYIDGVCISLNSYPECLGTKSKCKSCVFFDPRNCQLRLDASLRQELKTLLDVERERYEAQLRRQKALIHAVRQELQAHGRPLHYEVLARIVAERHPKLKITEASVLRIMSYHPEEFECIEVGVYQCKK